jgi:GntR family transcriptional regulator, vanillate catabolism transcriptional regulator
MGETTIQTHAMRALIELRKQILNGKLAAGTRLFEVAVADMLEISRTPVREAMSRLAEEGLIERARSGFVVRKFGIGDVVDAIELRGLLEGMAARLAAERGFRPDVMAAMKAATDRLEACFSPDGDVDFAAYAEHNATFHKNLAELAGSETIQRELERVGRLPFASPSAFLSSRLERYGRSLLVAQDQHVNLIQAIESQASLRAEFIAREHARSALRNIEKMKDDDRGVIEQISALAMVAS